jgi:hypothetical protein
MGTASRTLSREATRTRGWSSRVRADPFQTFVSSTQPEAPVRGYADVDGDGVLDVVTTGAPDPGVVPVPVTASVLRGLGRGAFGPSMSVAVSSDATSAGVLGIADVDGDGAADLIVGVQRQDETSAIRVYPGSATGFASQPVESPLRKPDSSCNPGVYAAAGWGWVATAGDLNGDGAADVAIAGCDGVDIYLSTPGQATLHFASAVGFALSGKEPSPGDGLPTSLIAADVDGDGLPDLVSARNDNGIGVARGFGDGTFAPVAVVAELPDPPWRIFVADINGDARPDVIAQGATTGAGMDSTVEVLLGGPSGIGTAPHVYTPVPAAGGGAKLLAVVPSPPRGTGTFVLEGEGEALQLVVGACQ